VPGDAVEDDPLLDPLLDPLADPLLELVLEAEPPLLSELVDAVAEPDDEDVEALVPADDDPETPRESVR